MSTNPLGFPDFEVLMSVYAGERPEYLDACMQSLAQQTRYPRRLVLVVDGPIPECLERSISSWRKQLPFELSLVRLPENKGLGGALSQGLALCSERYVARMDSDDVCMPDRFARQLGFVAKHPKVDIVGSAISEFTHDPDQPSQVRRVPLTDAAIRRMFKHRNPFNHMTVLFRRQAVLDAGGYQPCRGFEDYFLWARMLLHGAVCANLPEALVRVRVGAGMLERRRGLSYALDEIRFLRRLKRIGAISPIEYLRNLVVRLPVRVAPPRLLRLLYRRLRDPHR